MKTQTTKSAYISASTNIAILVLTGYILYYNIKHYIVSKEILEINKSILEKGASHGN